MKLHLILASGLLIAACGTPPKPAELVSFEQMRSEGEAETVRERFPDLYAEAEKYYKRALEAHEDGEPELALHHTRLASITWRTALARSHEKDAQDSLRAAEGRRRLADEDIVRAKLEIDRAAAMLRVKAMQQQLRDAEARASQEKKATEAKGKIDTVAQRLREAESMDAARHAPGPLNKAQASFKSALTALEAGDFKAAGEAASTALVDADAALAATKPLYEAEERTRTIDARLKALLEATGGLPDSNARITQRGLTLSVRELFPTGKTELAVDRTLAVDRVAQLVKDFAEFPVVIEGHTDNRGRGDANLVLSQARAQAVLGALQGRGVAASRLSAVGKGDSEPVADNSTRDGRAQNRRVDVVFLRPDAAPAK